MSSFSNIIRTIILAALLLSCSDTVETEPTMSGEKGKILIVVPPDDAYYSEYTVAREGLEALGYQVEVASIKKGTVSTYMLPVGATIEETANSLPEGNGYTAFKKQFLDLFGKDWNEAYNVVPQSIDVSHSILELQDLHHYSGMLIVGGTGALNLRLDGSYVSQAGSSIQEVKTAAEKLNDLANEALKEGKPVLAQCHAASLPVFWRVAGTGIGLLEGQQATGYPESETEITYAAQGVTLRAIDKVVVSSPHAALSEDESGAFKLITSRDWFPQSIAYATKVFANVLETYPDQAQLKSQKKVLIVHGGQVSEVDCSASNRQNDIPCNYGMGDNLPADYRNIKDLLEVTKEDGYNFQVTDLNITTEILPYSINNATSIESYLSDFEVIIFFKHWSTGITSAFQSALINYAENGGGVIALHHAVYNDVDDTNPALNKNSLTTQLFGSSSEETGWSGLRTSYNLYSTNYGHFISTYLINTSATQLPPPSWNANPMIAVANQSLSYYPVINVYDEVYLNKAFSNESIFGNEVNEIVPLFSNNLAGMQSHTEGYIRLFNKNSDSKVGKIVCFQPGESRQSFEHNSAYGQVIRNAVIWVSQK